MGMNPEREHAVAFLRHRAKNLRNPAVAESFYRYSPLLGAVPDAPREVRMELAARLALILANEVEGCATLLEQGNHFFKLRDIED